MFVYNNQNKLNLFNVIENKIYVIYTSKGNLKIVPNNVIINKNDSITLEVVYDGINDFEWHSSNEGFVTIKNGTIFALEEGSVIITCTAKDNPKISATCNVEVIGDGAIISNDRIIENEYPYISVYNFEPTLDINEQLDIQYYITDYTQKEIRENDYTDKFIVNCSIYTMPNENGDITLLSNRVIDNVSPGDNTISFTSAELGGVGDKFLVLEGKDINSEKHTHEFIKEFRVINKSSEQQNIDNNTYYMTTSDLSSYNIDNTGSTDPDVALNTRNGLQSLMNDKAALGIKKLVLLDGTYIIKYSLVKEALSIPDRFTLDLNQSTIKLLYDENNIANAPGLATVILKISHKYDSHVINGTICGDYLERGNISSSNGEHCYAVHDYGSKYSSFENLTIKDNTGYTMLWGYGDGSMGISAGRLTSFSNIDINNGQQIESTSRSTSDFISLEELYNLRMGSVCIYLGYQGVHTNYQACSIHFYDSNKNFIESKITFQWRRFLIPENAAYARVTMFGEASTISNNLELLYYYPTTNISVKNINFENTRTCALAPLGSRGAILDNITFTNCGHRHPTPLAIDFEDGWDLTQDVLIKNSEVLQPAGTGDLITCAGNNYQLENLTNMRITLRTFSTNRTTGVSIKNCQLKGSDFGAGHEQYKRTAWYRLNDCTALDTIKISNVEPMSFRVINNFEFLNGSMVNGNGTAYLCKLSDTEGKDFGSLNSTTGALNGATIKESTLNNIYWQLNSSKFVKCTSDKPVKFRINSSKNGDVTFYNCIFNNILRISGNSGSGMYFNNCDIKGICHDVSGDSTLDNQLIFENCNLTFNDPSDTIKSTGRKFFIKFINCTINSIYDKPIVHTSKSGNINVHIEFIDCIINKTTGTLIHDDYNDSYHTDANLSIILSNTPISIDLGNNNIMNSKIWKIENS